MLGNQRSLWLIVALGAGLICGAICGALIMRQLIRPGYEILASLPWSSAINGTSRETKVLEKLRAGDTTGATALLEKHLDEDLYVLGSYETDVPTHFRSEADYRVLRRAAEYRDKYPRATSIDESSRQADAVVAKALTIWRNHVPAP